MWTPPGPELLVWNLPLWIPLRAEHPTLLTQFASPSEVAALQGHLMGSAEVNNPVSVLSHCLPGFWLSLTVPGCPWLSLAVCVTEGLPRSWLLRDTSSQQRFQCHTVGFLSWLWIIAVTQPCLLFPVCSSPTSELPGFRESFAVPWGRRWVWDRGGMLLFTPWKDVVCPRPCRYLHPPDSLVI